MAIRGHRGGGSVEREGGNKQAYRRYPAASLLAAVRAIRSRTLHPHKGHKSYRQPGSQVIRNLNGSAL